MEQTQRLSEFLVIGLRVSGSTFEYIDLLCMGSVFVYVGGMSVV